MQFEWARWRLKDQAWKSTEGPFIYLCSLFERSSGTKEGRR